jgi:hypothetical protein
MMMKPKFIVVLVALSVSIVSCGRVDSLPAGYEIRYGDRGKVWVFSSDGMQTISGVTSVWVLDDEFVVEVRHLSSEPPYELENCIYFALNADRSALILVNQSDILPQIAEKERKAQSRRSCI